MPQAPARPCRYKGCPGLTTEQHGYCPKHAHIHVPFKRPDKRASSNDRGYDYQWTKIRAAYIAKNPLCERCLNQGVTVKASRVHHRDHNQHNNDESNLEALCNACHEREHGPQRYGHQSKPKEPPMFPMG